jgi:ribulose-phosphate 3-epimerase
MDGHFVPNISYGNIVLKSLEARAEKPFDVHLMVTDPDKYFRGFLSDKTEIITFHHEAVKNPLPLISEIKNEGVKAGVSIKPSTLVSEIEPYIEDIDVALVMTVEPGFGGQKLIGNAAAKIEELANLRLANGYDFIIEADGGIDLENIGRLKDMGGDLFVLGSSLFKAVTNDEEAEAFREALEK